MAEIEFKIKEKDKLSALQDAYRVVFGGPAGQMVLGDLVKVCGVFAVNIAEEPAQMGRLEGRRAIGLYIVSLAGGYDLAKISGGRK